MPKPTAAITAVNGYLPPDLLTNFDLEKMVDTTDEWIRSRSGIERRHFVAEGQTTSDLATLARERRVTRTDSLKR
jgi:3-oxoacyl-[acyl-carrier-protein] synthase-3